MGECFLIIFATIPKFLFHFMDLPRFVDISLIILVNPGNTEVANQAMGWRKMPAGGVHRSGVLAADHCTALHQ
jgi:hypothetical protein